MLTMRSPQMTVLSEDLRRRFQHRLMDHAQRYFPDVCQMLGYELRATVRTCIRRGQKYGFTSQRDLCKFLNLTFIFGREFDRDPRCGWATEILPGGLPGPFKMS